MPARAQRPVSFTGHKVRVKAVAWSPDGRRVASGGDNTVQVWDAGTGQRLGSYTGHTDNSARRGVVARWAARRLRFR